ncbi:sugar ABC transporter ATP-binding protein [Pleomorphomonas koreensis]|uniref:sugar ABC transporter ATP-binding protein n=1 Tax=Pleomorphomonas koreensis TaxID=257440 RepID=UPI0004076AEE|nr:sugar ABC transporter ATP-binding protein [Pleomorphomonas koreensis]
MQPVLRATDISKSFGAVRALEKARLTVQRGEIHALLGANGCGKSTLCKIIAGTVGCDAGEVLIDGAPAALGSPRLAEEQGVALFYQELSLVPQLSVGDNVFLGREPRNALGFTDRAAIFRETEALIARVATVAGAGLTPDALVADLSPDQRQLTEILKVLARKPKIIIFDEATATLDRRQVEVFFDILRELRAGGVSSIFISHRMDEVFAIADRITVMRNGQTVAEFSAAETDRYAVVYAMVGETGAIAASVRDHAPLKGDARLVVEGVKAARLGPVSFTAQRGEILGLGGLQGQGQKALLSGLFGAEPFAAGRVTLDGVDVTARRPAEAIAHRIAYVSGDRGRDSALPGRSIFENTAIASLVRERRHVIPGALFRTRFAEVLSGLNTRYAGLDAPIGSLSGGNQQKVFISRWLSPSPGLLLLDDPTKGIDLGAKGDFYLLARKLADEGATVIIYSSEDSELLSLCDRVLVLNGGTVTADLTGERLTPFELTRASYGDAA